MSHKAQRVFLIIITGMFLGLIGWFGYQFVTNQSVPVIEPACTSDDCGVYPDSRAVSTNDDEPVSVFNFIPDQSVVNIEAMVANTLSSIDTDTNYYRVLRSYDETDIVSVPVREVLDQVANESANDALPQPIMITTDTVATIQAGDITIGDVYESDTYPYTKQLLTNITADLDRLVTILSAEYSNQVGPVSARIPDLMTADEQVFSYPPRAVVDALATEKLLLLLIDTAATQLASETIINTGVAAGQYALSDTMAAETLVDQYLKSASRDASFSALYDQAATEF